MALAALVVVDLALNVLFLAHIIALVVLLGILVFTFVHGFLI